MAFCQKCGAKTEGDVFLCEACAAKVSDKPRDYKKIGIAVVAIAAIIIISLIVSIFSSMGYKKALGTYFDVFIECEDDDLKETAPEAFWDYIEDRSFFEDKQEIYDALEKMVEARREYNEEYYGDNYKVKYKITYTEKLDKDGLKNIKNNLKNSYNIQKSSITDAVEVEVSMRIKGSEDEDEMNRYLTIVKIKGKWYVTDSFDFTSSGSIYY